MVLLPEEIRSTAQLLQQYDPDLVHCDEFQKNIPLSYAEKLIVQLQLSVHKQNAHYDREEFETIKAYLNEYQNYITNPLSWIYCEDDADDSTRAVTESRVVLDLWVQHALRARLIAIDAYANIVGNLNVRCNMVVNKNLAVGKNMTVGGSLTVDGPASFTGVSIGSPSGCSGILALCGMFILNGTGITGPTNLTGQAGPQGALGAEGPTGPQGPAGSTSLTGSSFTLLGTGNSTGCTNGTLVVNGGVGIGGNLNVCGYINTFTDYRLDTFPILDATGTNLSIGIGSSSVTAGSNNVFIGRLAGQHNVTGSFNTVAGQSAAQSLTIGTDNTVLGQSAGQSLISGSENAFLGFEAGMNMAGADSNNTYIGSQAGSILSGASNNVVIGSLAANSVGAGFSQSVIIGASAGQFASSGNNVFVGFLAGQNPATADGGNHVLIGNQTTTNPGNGNTSNTALGSGAAVTNAGATSNATAIGAGAINNLGSNSILLGTSLVNTYVSTPTPGSGSIFFPTVGGTPTGLNYYEEAIFATSVTYGTSALVPITLNFRRIGNRVTLRVPQIGPITNPSGNNNTYLFPFAIPARFTPATNQSFLVAAIVDPGTGNRYSGEFVIEALGFMQLFDTGTATGFFPMTTAQTDGDFNLTYNLS